MKTKEPRGWLVCDKGVCLYREDAKVCRCIKHGAILSYNWRLTGARTRQEAKARFEALPQ
jgi:hypothetical protein